MSDTGASPCGLLDELNFNMLPWQLMIFTDMLFLSTVSFSSNRSSQPWLRQFHTRHCLCWSLLFISFSAGSTKDFRSLLCWWFYLWSLSSVPLEWNLCPRFRSWALFCPSGAKRRSSSLNRLPSNVPQASKEVHKQPQVEKTGAKLPVLLLFWRIC